MTRNQNPNYRDDAICAQSDPETFFPQKGSLGQMQIKEAKRICSECSVAYFCLTDALESGALGIWGGTTEKERGYLKRQKGGALARYIFELEQRLDQHSA
jgi:WhiB family redox-sensing transcriptional regulator